MENKTECAVCHSVLVVDILKIYNDGKPSVKTIMKTIAINEVQEYADCFVRQSYCLNCGIVYRYTPTVMTIPIT